MGRTVVLQVKGAPTPGVNPFAKKKTAKKKPGDPADATVEGQDPAVDDPEDQQDGGADEATEDQQAPGAAVDKEDLVDGGADEDLEDDNMPAHEPDPNEQQADPADPSTNPNGTPEDQADTVHPHEWAGDVYEDGDETDPGQSFAAFTGQGGEEAWLDRADDGTITGWVRDADGTVYRYSDDNAWATDVDDAGMQQTHGPQPGQQAGQDDPMQQQGPGAQAAPPAERSLFDEVAKKDAAGGLVVVDQGAIAAELAALGQPHLQAWAKR